MLNEHDTVCATKNLSVNILTGCKGTIVFVYTDPRLAYEVEFFDDIGVTIELLTVEPNEIVLQNSSICR